MSIVLDASAVLAFIREKEGADVVDSFFRQQEEGDFGIFAHSTNLAEVYYDVLMIYGRTVAQNTVQELRGIGVIESNELGVGFWREMAELIAFRRAMPRDSLRPDAVPHLSLGDAFGLTLVYRLGIDLVTADRKDIEPLVQMGRCNAPFIR